MLKFVDPSGCIGWYQQLPHVEVALVPVRERSPNNLISLDQAFVSGVPVSLVRYEHAGISCCRYRRVYTREFSCFQLH
jgi:hypothetical protein